jgi:hypothetical protein
MCTGGGEVAAVQFGGGEIDQDQHVLPADGGLELIDWGASTDPGIQPPAMASTEDSKPIAHIGRTRATRRPPRPLPAVTTSTRHREVPIGTVPLGEYRSADSGRCGVVPDVGGPAESGREGQGEE